MFISATDVAPGVSTDRIINNSKGYSRMNDTCGGGGGGGGGGWGGGGCVDLAQ